jgi:hypothetical protein
MKKLNRLINEWPRGAVLTSQYLKKKNITSQDLKQYRKSGWIESIAKGVYKLKGDTIDWQGGVYGLQQEKDIYIGGKSALQLKGLGHYLAPEIRTLFLYSSSLTSLPKWFKNMDWGINVYFTSLHLFNRTIEDSFTGYKHKEFTLKISAPERAVLEMLYHVPLKQSFDEAMKIMESLTTLRPQLIQKLLEACNSVKVKRLFLYMAESQNHFWFEHLNLNNIDLGSGKRSIVKNGVLNKKYLITVPGESEQ